MARARRAVTEDAHLNKLRPSSSNESNLAMCENITIEQHYLAMTYLKPWASKRSKRKYWVHLYDKSRNISEERRTDRVMKENDIYTIFLEDGRRDLKWEHKFRDLENEYAISRDRTENLGSISGEDDRAVFLRFLAAQVHRTPSMRTHLKKFLQQVEYIKSTLKIESRLVLIRKIQSFICPLKLHQL